MGIKPTPSIGGVGLIKDYKKMVTMDFKEINNLVILILKILTNACWILMAVRTTV